MHERAGCYGEKCVCACICGTDCSWLEWSEIHWMRVIKRIPSFISLWLLDWLVYTSFKSCAKLCSSYMWLVGVNSLKYFLCTLIVCHCITADGTTSNLLAKLSALCTENTARDIVNKLLWTSHFIWRMAAWCSYTGSINYVELERMQSSSEHDETGWCPAVCIIWKDTKLFYPARTQTVAFKLCITTAKLPPKDFLYTKKELSAPPTTNPDQQGHITSPYLYSAAHLDL